MSMAVPQRMVIEKKQDRGQTRVALQCRDPRPTISPRPNGDLMARSLMKIHRLVPILVMALAAGCATTPPPTGLLDQANARIRAADAAGAATRAPGDFAEAQRRFAFAQAALADGDNEQAAASAEEAAAAAETARARAHAVELETRIRNQSDENANLQADLEQKQAEAAAAQQAASQPASGGSSEELPPIQLGAPGMGEPVPASSDMQPTSGDSAAFPPSGSSVHDDEALPPPASSSGAYDQGSGS